MSNIEYKHDYWDVLEAGGKVSRTPEKRWTCTGPNNDVGDGITQVNALESLVHTLSAKIRLLQKQLEENGI